MGLDKAFSLPKLSNTPDSLVNYAVPSTDTLVNEGFAAVQSKFGGVGSFNSLNVGAPSFVELGASYALGTVPSTDLYYGTAASVVTGITDSTASATQIRDATGDTAGIDNNDHMVKLVSTLDPADIVLFTVMPEVSEARTAEYEPLAASQMPGEFQKYKGTKATTWQVTAKFTCRTRKEAFTQFSNLQLLRTWVMPYFGERQSGDRLGSPPAVLKFSGWRGLVGPVPVVIQSLNWQWPPDCDWIPTGELDDSKREIPFPTVMTVQIQLVESFSATQFNNFDLLAFGSGDMIGAYSSVPTKSVGSVAEPVTPQAGAGRGVLNEKPGEREEHLKVQLQAAQAKFEADKAFAEQSLKAAL